MKSLIRFYYSSTNLKFDTVLILDCGLLIDIICLLENICLDMKKEKRKKKRKTEEFIQSQLGAIDKFLNRNIDNIIKSSNTDLVDEEVQNEDDQVQENMNEEHKNLVDHEQKIFGDGENRNEQYEIINKEHIISDFLAKNTRRENLI